MAEKAAAEFTYKGEQGYMPMIGHLAEAGVVIHDELRDGNVAPATQNLEFIQACEARLPKGHVIAHVRLDSAGYQADIFNYCEDTGKTFAIGGRLDAPTQQAMAGIPESAWKHYPLQAKGTHAIFLTCYKPHRKEPRPKWFTSVLEHRASRQSRYATLTC